ncbi:hypothetical protein [Tenacibaculum crassostreae]|uniref:hypothetical protein n=1 Tax=Tenacibaculum crassostreae TaxID=502683 RepID=UPI003895315F
MNYGKEFIKLYNEELSAFKKVIIKRIEKDYGSPEVSNDLYSKYVNEMRREKNEIEKNDNKGRKETSITGISLGYMNKQYKFNRIENIVNRDIYNYFMDHAQNSQYKDFNHFLECYSKYLVLLNYSLFLSENLRLFCSFIDEEKARVFFNIKYVKNDLNVLVLSKEAVGSKKSIPSEEADKKVEKNNAKLNKEAYDNPFTEEEKFILIRYLFEYERTQEKKLSVYELTLILKISCDVFTGKKLEKVKDTVYEKYHKGYIYYGGSDREKKNRLKILIEKCKAFKLNNFAEYLNHEMFKMKFS